MNGKAERLRDYLSHIAVALDRIISYTDGISRERFLADPLLQDAVIRNLEIIGEASRNILRDLPDFASENGDLPLKAAYEMRNVLAHGYFEVDLEIVWRTIVSDLPDLAVKVARVRRHRFGVD
jgi:uncharacterized protein with HEPN domain